MAEKEKKIFKGVIEIFNKLSMQQKIFIGGIFVVMIILLGSVFLMVNEPEYSTLYSNLTMEDAGKVVKGLEETKISYKLENNGTTIKIPKDKLYGARLNFASKGIPTSGTVGYEIFDNNSMGMSEFMQKLNFKRALEGEIAKTIIQQDGISGARVHIVFPQKAIFKEDQKEPSASVTLKLSTQGITQENIMAIKYLVSSSVEGLKPGKVTIIDNHGKVLSEIEEENSLSAKSGKQYEIKKKVEKYLVQKAQSVLDNVLGFGNSVVEVNVDLDFKKVDRTQETVDPESQTAISEQTVNQENTGTSISDSNASSSKNVVTNYELSKTIERVIDDVGGIKRVTLAAVINGITKTVKADDGSTSTVVEPRTDEQLQKLEQILRQTVGIDDKRNDQINVVSIAFENNELEETVEEASPLDKINDWSNLILILGAIGAALFILKSLMKKLKNEKIIIGTLDYKDGTFGELAPGASSAAKANLSNAIASKKKELLEEPIGDIEEEISEDAQVKKRKKEKIISYVSKNPVEAAKLINTWLREDEY